MIHEGHEEHEEFLTSSGNHLLPPFAPIVRRAGAIHE